MLINYIALVMTMLSPSHTPKEIPIEAPLMTIIQGSAKQQVMPGTNKITLFKAPFEIQFQLNNYNAGRNTIFQFAAFKNRESLDLTEDGKMVFNIPYFAPGSGLPRPRRGPYQLLNLNKEGHHCIMYESETSRTCDMLTELDEGGYLLKWSIDSVYENKTAFALKDIEHSEIFCVAFFDKNKNKVTDAGEYAKIEIDFK